MADLSSVVVSAVVVGLILALILIATIIIAIYLAVYRLKRTDKEESVIPLGVVDVYADIVDSDAGENDDVKMLEKAEPLSPEKAEVSTIENSSYINVKLPKPFANETTESSLNGDTETCESDQQVPTKPVPKKRKPPKPPKPFQESSLSAPDTVQVDHISASGELYAVVQKSPAHY